MYVYDCIIFELQRAGGISVYWSELLRRNNSRHIYYFGRKNGNLFTAGFTFQFRDEDYPKFINRRYLPFLSRSIELSVDKYIFHSSYFRYSNSPKAINVTTVHDFTYEYYLRGWRKWIHSLQKKTAVKRSSGVICVSEKTRQDLLNFYPWVDPNRVRVIHNGVGSEFYPVKGARDKLESELDFESDNPFLLFVGDRSAYKNFDVFIELAKRFPSFDLVIVGGKPLSKEEKRNIENSNAKFMHFTGVSSGILNLLYNSAFCLVYPSSYEGFGIPLLEAMKAGCPVVSTNSSSIPEVAGGAALLVDEIKVECFAEEIRKLSDESFRNRLIQKGFSRADRFSWDKCFEETYAFYQELLKRSELE